jgi:pimeloyl-ACP methyl ester carboxylesterase
LQSWRALYPLTLASSDLRHAWDLQAYSWLFTDRTWRSETQIRAALRFAREQPPQSVAGFLGQVDAALSFDSRPQLPTLAVATLIVHGSQDQLSPPSNGEELARLIPGAELLSVPEAGHAVNLEAQRQVNQALRSHWKRSS